jgi:hypothetical protein
MNTYELDTQTLRNIDEADTAEARQTLSPGFLASYNRAYTQICAERLRPAAWEQVALDGNRQFDPTQLAHSILPGGILAVRQAKDFSLEAGYGRTEGWQAFWQGDMVAVPQCGLSQVWVCYRYYPAALANPNPADGAGNSSVPDLLEDTLHTVLCMAAAEDYFRERRKFDREHAWAEAYAKAVCGIARQRDGSDAVLNGKYPVQPGCMASSSRNGCGQPGCMASSSRNGCDQPGQGALWPK